MKQISFLAFH